MEKFLRPHEGFIKNEDRQRLNGHRSAIVWFTGLPSSGKSTLAHRLEETLFRRGVRTCVIDGDNVRTGLNKDLGFSPEDRQENIRRIGEVAKLFVESGIVVMTAFISPYRKDRNLVRNLVNKDEFIEVYVKCPLSLCEQRDGKGHYKMARQGIIKRFTGIEGSSSNRDSTAKQPHVGCENQGLTLQQLSSQIKAFFLKHSAYIFVTQYNIANRNLQFWPAFLY